MRIGYFYYLFVTLQFIIRLQINKIKPTMRILIIAAMYCVLVHTCFAQNSVLATGDFYKLAITNAKGGIYKIDRNFLAQLGINVQEINPKNIRIYGNGGGMLPQANSTNRANDLLENAIFVSGENDGKFDNNDYILFYAEGCDKLVMDKENKFIAHEKNLYDQNNYYFLTISNVAGKRIAPYPTLPPALQTFDTFEDVDYFEDDKANIGESGRYWFGNVLNSFANTQNFALKNFSNLADNATLKVSFQAWASARVRELPQGVSLKISLNDKELSNLNFSPVSGDKYDPQGVIMPFLKEVKTFVARNFIDNNGNANIKLNLDSRGSNNGSARFDFITINVQRKLQLYGTQTRFRNLNSIQNATAAYRIGNITDLVNTQVWDITNPTAIFSHTLSTLPNNIATFTATSEVLKEYIVLQNNANFEAPKAIGKIAEQNLHNFNTPDLLIVTHPAFLEAAQRLAKFRNENDKLTTEIATTEQVYNEFSSGRKDVTAIRDFARYLYKKSNKLKYLLLFGNASYDFRTLTQSERDYVPTYQSYESNHPINSFCSDDYFALLADDEGGWEESFGNKDQMYIGVGRLPVRIGGNLERAKATANTLVDKIIAYNAGASLGNWRNRVTFIADTDDGEKGNYSGIFQEESDRFAEKLAATYPRILLNKLYLDAFPTELTANGNFARIARNRLDEAVQEGSLLINFIGHGSISGWTSKRVLDQINAPSWSGINNMPLFMTATCEFGRYDGTALTSAEEALLNVKGGAIALLTTTRPVYNNNNAEINEAFLNTVLKSQADGTMPRLGDVIKLTKNASIVGFFNRNFALLGDPSMMLAYPKQETIVTKIEVDGKESNVLTALSKVTISGEIVDKGLLDNTFNGTIDIKLLDKKYTTTTLGRLDRKMNFALQDNLLFKGLATVTNGKFSFSFIVPKNIDYREGSGKISLYAYNDTRTRDAAGAIQNFSITGSRKDTPEDNTPPQISIYMDNENFVSGSQVNPNTTLFATISDASGFNLSSAGIGQQFTVILNDTLIYVVNDYFQPFKDDFTKGKLVFPLKNLPAGKYTLKFRVWDTYNNPAESILTFYIAQEPFKITATAFPNPFEDKITIRFSHNKGNIPITVSYEFYNTLGQIVYKPYPDAFEIGGEYEKTWNGLQDGTGERLATGVYFYRILITKEVDKQEETAVYTGKIMLSR